MDERPERWSALDNLRGLTVLLMIPVNAGMDFASIPAWLTHAPGRGLTLADFIMPAFLFALGRNPLLSYILGGVLTLALRAWVPADIPEIVAWALSLSVLVLVTAAALVLEWRKIWIRL